MRSDSVTKSEPAPEVKKERPEFCSSKSQQQSPAREGRAQVRTPAQPSSTSDHIAVLQAAAPVEHEINSSTEALVKAVSEKKFGKSPIQVRACSIVEEILDGLAEVESLMRQFREYIKVHEVDDKPLYQWATYPGYSRLRSAVQELDKATAKFKRARLSQEYISASVARATESSISVSKAAAYALAVLNKKTASFMEEMETSTLSDDAKLEANAVISGELQKLMEHSTLATERVWVATDLLRTLKAKQGTCKDWAWSAAGTIMTGSIAAAVAIFTAHFYGPSGFSLTPIGGHHGDMYRQVVELVQHTQAVTNLTGELYTMKLQDINDRYETLAAMSESHGERIDNIVDGLGPPNAEGLYYVSVPKAATSDSSKYVNSRIRQASDDTARQMERLQEEMQLMRKNVNRMDIRLSKGIDKCLKDNNST